MSSDDEESSSSSFNTKNNLLEKKTITNQSETNFLNFDFKFDSERDVKLIAKNAIKKMKNDHVIY